MARAPALPADTRRALLLDASRAVFGRLGYHEAGVADIVAEAKVARGTFYRHFESKRAAFDAVLEQMMDNVVGVIVPIDVTRPISPQVAANLDRLVGAIMVEDVARVLFAEAVGIDGEGDAVLRAFYGEALGRIEAALRTGQQLGVVRAGDVHLTARCLLGVIKEPVFQAALYGEDLDPDALIAEIGLLLQGGVLRGPAGGVAG